VSFYLEPVDGEPLPVYPAGQFLTFQLELGDCSAGGRSAARCYSLSDRHDSQAYRVTIKRIPAPHERPDLPPGLVSNHFHDHVLPGTVLQVPAPAGLFVLGEDASVPAVLIAGGVGITPLFAMAREALVATPDRAIHLFHGVRDARDRVFAADLLALAERHLNFRITFVHSGPPPNGPASPKDHETGYIDVAFLRRVLPYGQHQFYVCGPPPMMSSLVPELRDWGVAGDAVRYEAFGPASIESAEHLGASPLASPVEVRFARSERTLSWTGGDTNLLDFAERHGVAVDSGCRSGSCGTCATALFSGEVRYAQKPAFDLAKGQCLLCVGAPTGDLVLEA
jgi:ferredoxin-NADP reductase